MIILRCTLRIVLFKTKFFLHLYILNHDEGDSIFENNYLNQLAVINV